MRFFRVKVGDYVFKVGVEKIREGVYRVKIGKKEAEISVEESLELRDFENVEKEIGLGKVMEVKKEELGRVVSMLPGVVLKILVNPGDRVKIGDPLMIIESMKMENEIVSPVDGEVRRILVKEGQRIEAGDLLAVVK
ncbi:hypothetical protein DRP04_01435 [Archaeoglobales archaeon]|nr:MAG: hypothetical protein DRP04_01435 [Archaeoglobales archaeon]HDN73478.1 biotin/lipoyl-binding protein [Archaeoglobus sp.]